MDIQRLAELSIADILQRWPQTVTAFQRRKMACVGCALAPFYSVVDAAIIYGLDSGAFLEELRALIEDGDLSVHGESRISADDGDETGGS